MPTDRLYPFQWNWDSAFVAMGWATFDEARGFTEVERLLEGQWDDGLVPQIVFHAPSDDYFPGPAVWGVQHAPPTSGITQPPVLASAVRRMLGRARDRAAAEARVAAIYPRLVASHRWWQRARDPRGQRPGVDAASLGDGHGQQPCLGCGAGARAGDDNHASAAARHVACGCVDAAARGGVSAIHSSGGCVPRCAAGSRSKMLAASPFRVADIATNSILLRAERDLLVLRGDLADRASGGKLRSRDRTQDQRSAGCGMRAPGCFGRWI